MIDSSPNMPTTKKTKTTSSHFFSIIIINYQSADYVIDCLKSFLKFERQTHRQWEVIILENGSPDQKTELAKLKKYLQQVAIKSPLLKNRLQLQISPHNLGFGGGNNYAVQFARGDHLFFLNGDTVFFQPIIPKISDFLTNFTSFQHPSNSEHQALPLIIAPSLWLAPHQIQPFSFGKFPTLLRLLFQTEKKFWRRKTEQLSNSHSHAPANSQTYQQFNQSQPFPVDWVTGAAFIINKSAFQKVGGFDQKYFMYYEDIDLCRQIRLEFGDHKIWLLPTAELIHLGGKSIQLNRDRYQLYFQAQDYYFRKNFSPFYAFLFRFLRFPYKFLKLNF